MPNRSRFARYINPILSALHELGDSARPGEVFNWIAACGRARSRDERLSNFLTNRSLESLDQFNRYRVAIQFMNRLKGSWIELQPNKWKQRLLMTYRAGIANAPSR